MVKKLICGLIAALSAQSFPTTAAECAASSGVQITPLLELYTSEGCSSCPPADQWLSTLTSAGYDSSKVTPLAFHVDYWDYIGWKDRFAKASYSERQRQAASSSGSTFVYTPQLLLNGRDLRGWQSSDRFGNVLQAAAKDEARVALKITLKQTDKDQASVSVMVQPKTSLNTSNSDLYLAINESRLKSSVNAGENSGRELHHDYVVRELYGPFPLNQLKNNQLIKDIVLKSETGKDALGLVAFIQNRSTNTIEQSLSLPIKSCGNS